MRLTLRTLLAYLDDVLDPVDKEELAHKIESSEFARELVHQSRDSVRRLRLSAPQVLGTGIGLDPNTVAEYLDNLMPPEQVGDFERICLESPVHLAEVAASHHVLTMVLGAPADVDPIARQRMYTISKEATERRMLRIEPAHTAMSAATTPAAAVAPVAPMATPASAPSATPRRPVEVPEYLRAGAWWQSTNAVLVLATVVLIGAGIMFFTTDWFGGGNNALSETAENTPTTPPTNNGVNETPTDTNPGAPIAAAPPETTDSTPTFTSPPPAATPAMPNTTTAPPVDTTVGTAAAVPGPPVTTTPPTATPPAEGSNPYAANNGAATPPATTPATDGNTALPAVGGPMPLPPAAGATADTGAAPPLAAPDLTLPAFPAPIDPSAPSANQTAGPPAATTPGNAADVMPPATPPADAAAAPAATPPTDTIAAATPRNQPNATLAPPTAAIPEGNARVALPPVAPPDSGTYMGGKTVLLRHDDKTGAWFRIEPRAAVVPGERILALPEFRPRVALVSGLQLDVTGGTQIVMGVADGSEDKAGDAAASDVVPALEIVYGRIVLVNPTNTDKQIRLKLGKNVGVASIGHNRTLAVELERKHVPGLDPRTTAAPIDAKLYAPDGGVSWHDGAGDKTADKPVRWALTEAGAADASDLTTLPEWIDHEPVVQVSEQKLGAPIVESTLVSNVPVSTQLVELFQNKNRKEVRSLVARSSVYVNLFSPFIDALRDSDQRPNWKNQIQALRAAMSLSPESATAVYTAIADQRGKPAAADLYEMLCGYDVQQIGQTPEQIKTGAISKLIDRLENDGLDYRVLAWQNLLEITGMQLMPNPAAKLADRTIQVRKWRNRLDAGEVKVQAPVAAAQP